MLTGRLLCLVMDCYDTWLRRVFLHLAEADDWHLAEAGVSTVIQQIPTVITGQTMSARAPAQGGPAATAQGGPAATSQGRPAATAIVPSAHSVIEMVNSMEILYEESHRRLHQTEKELRLAHVKIYILEDRSPRTGRKRDHTNTEREREPKIRKELEEDAKSGEEKGEEAGGGREDVARDTEWVVDRLLSESGEEEIQITEE